MHRIARIALAALLWAATSARGDGPFERFDLPDAWEARFWAEANTLALLKLDPKAVADLVPVQAGLRHCRCPKCGALDGDDPMSWSLARPDVLTCRKCSKTVPDADVPAKVDNKIPEEVVEVLPRRLHHYPYHVVEAEKQRHPDEKIYLNAKRDYEAREFLAKATLYAAVRHREAKDPALARLACVILLRFAQVYPAYATHFDQPGQPKFLDRADLPPPYRRGYGTGKWDWSGCLDVPLDLVVAHALVRDDPAMAEAGKLLGDPHPVRTIDRQLFRASAEFVRRQPPEDSPSSLYSIRGLLAVGRLLDDPGLVHDGGKRLESLLARGFYHDGVWMQGDGAPQRRVMGQIDGWVDRLLAGYSDPVGYVPPDGSRRWDRLAGLDVLPTLQLVRSADSEMPARAPTAEVLLASWPAPPAPKSVVRRPALLGGAGIVRMGVGSGEDALDLDLRGLGDFGNRPSARLAVRVNVGGRAVLGDLDDAPPSPWGFDRSTASRNTVVVDGLNQRENLGDLRNPCAGSEIAFFAADPDFQVALMSDRFAYARSTTAYRRTILLAASGKTRYGVSLFEIQGGLQHDEFFQAAAGSQARWKTSLAMTPGPASLLPSSIPFLPEARPEDGRWFVQAMGGFSELAQARTDKPSQAELVGDGPPGMRLHLLPDAITTVFTATTPDPSADGRAALVVRRRSDDGSSLDTAFATVFEPIGISPPLKRVGRVAGKPDAVVLAIETAEGTEYLVVNRKASATVEAILPDRRTVRTDGLAVRVTPRGSMLAGGTFAEVGGRRLQQTRANGKIVAAQAVSRGEALGLFTTAEPIPDPSTLAGRALLVRHGDGTSRGWTIVAVENPKAGGAKILVRERPGFRIDPTSGDAVYENFPSITAPGPHSFGISKIAR